jgi:hypothetical protein
MEEFTKEEFTKEEFTKEEFTKEEFTKEEFTKEEFTKEEFTKEEFTKKEFTIDVREKYLKSGNTNRYYLTFKGVTLTLEQVNSNLFIITKKEPLEPTESESDPCLGIIHIDDECSLIYNEFGKKEDINYRGSIEDEQKYLGIVTGVKWNNVNIYLVQTTFEILNGKRYLYNLYNYKIRPAIIEYGYIEAQNIESVKEALTHVWMVEYDPQDI